MSKEWSANRFDFNTRKFDVCALCDHLRGMHEGQACHGGLYQLNNRKCTCRLFTPLERHDPEPAPK